MRMEDLKQLLKSYYERYPQMEIRDAIKFLHQSYMGPGHLISDEGAALHHLEEEWNTLSDSCCPQMGLSVGNGLFRLNLSYCKAHSLSTKTLFSMFFQTAKNWNPDRVSLEKSLDLIDTLPFPREEIRQSILEYRNAGCPMVSHSETYRSCYNPSYRIVLREYALLLPILSSIDKLMKAERPVRVAIDGPCASGKSTLGKMLSELYCCPLISMDDFFLRPEQRTPSRLAEPGGNVDYQRFQQEVLAPLVQDKPFSYRPWDCHRQSFSTPRVIPSSPLTIVEGSYSLRPDLREHYHLRIWVEAPPKVRRQRLLERDGPEMLERFLSLWIPMEDRYFSSCKVKECCHLVWDGNSP